MSVEYCKIEPGTKVLLTGATGFTGSVLAHKLAEAGLNINAIARNSSKVEELSDIEINWFRGEVFDPDVVAAATAGCRYVFHVAAAYREAKLSDQDYWNTHVKSTRLLAEAALSNNDFGRFVHISTVGVHSHIENPPANEEYPIAPADIYQKTKAEAEIWFRGFAQKNQLPYTVLRPAAIYGPGDRRLLKVFRLAASKYFPILGKGKCLYHLIHVDDLTNIMMLAATHPEAADNVFICGNKDSIPLEEMAGIIAETMDKRVHFMRLPAWPFFAAAHFCEWICKPLGIEPPIYPRRVAFFTKDRAFDTSKMQNKLGYSPLHSNKGGLAQTTRWYMKNGWL